MGLDISVIHAPKVFDLCQIYALHDAVESGFDWYLGDNPDQRRERHGELRKKALGLSALDVVEAVKGRQNDVLYSYLSKFGPDALTSSLGWVVGSMKDYEDGDTHLFFNLDLLPGSSSWDSCSWNMRELLLDCASDRNPVPNPNGDLLVELDSAKLKTVSDRWNRKSMKFKLWLCKWIGYFMPETGDRIRMDIANELGIQDAFVDVSDIEYYGKSLKYIVKATDGDKYRVWLASSY